jgi:ABC-type nitrate/sulfonate/bicarbonate transport system substrate-binding protein
VFGPLKRLTILLGALVLSLVGSGCQAAPSAPATPSARLVHFMAGYKPQANLPFVGAYLAQANGYFAEQGLSVEITHATGQGEQLKLLLQGSIDVTTDSADQILLHRSQGLPIVGMAVLGQRGQRAFAVLANSLIRTPRDWEGHTVGYKVEPSADYLALLAAAGVDRSRLQEVSVGFDPRLLAAGKVDVYPVFESNEPDTLDRLGAPVRLFRPSDYGVPVLGLAYVTSQTLLERDPDRLARFLRATLRGVRYARDHLEEATDVVMRYAPEEDRDHQLAMLRVELDMANGPLTAERGVGWTSHDQRQAVHDSLLQFGGLNTPADVDATFPDQILRLAYENSAP